LRLPLPTAAASTVRLLVGDPVTSRSRLVMHPEAGDYFVGLRRDEELVVASFGAVCDVAQAHRCGPTAFESCESFIESAMLKADGIDVSRSPAVDRDQVVRGGWLAPHPELGTACESG
jgi:hypothetical protein